jgi:hypothetical protein
MMETNQYTVKKYSREAAYLLNYFFLDFLGKTWKTSLRRLASVPGLDLGTRSLHLLFLFTIIIRYCLFQSLFSK